MNCPSCQCENTQTIKMVLLSGNSVSKGSAVGMDIRGDIGIAGTSSITRTNLAAVLDPGEKPVFNNMVSTMGVVFGILSTGGGVVFLIIGIEAAWYLIACGIFMLFIGWKSRDDPEFGKKAVAHWEQKVALKNNGWICHRCGHTWLPENR